MTDTKFNNYSLTNDEVEKIIKEFEKDIQTSSIFSERLMKTVSKKLEYRYIKL